MGRISFVPKQNNNNNNKTKKIKLGKKIYILNEQTNRKLLGWKWEKKYYIGKHNGKYEPGVVGWDG